MGTPPPTPPPFGYSVPLPKRQGPFPGPFSGGRNPKPLKKIKPLKFLWGDSRGWPTLGTNVRFPFPEQGMAMEFARYPGFEPIDPYYQPRRWSYEAPYVSERLYAHSEPQRFYGDQYLPRQYYGTSDRYGLSREEETESFGPYIPPKRHRMKDFPDPKREPRPEPEPGRCLAEVDSIPPRGGEDS